MSYTQSQNRCSRRRRSLSAQCGVHEDSPVLPSRPASPTATALLAILLILGSADAAAAHGGEVEFVSEVGPFFVEVVDEALPDGTLLYTLTLRDATRGLPVDDALVTVSASLRAQRFGPEPASRFANAYQVILPFPNPEAWTVDISIAHPDFDPVGFSHGLHDSAGDPWWTSRRVLIGAWLLQVLAAYGLIRRRGPLRPRTTHR